jgi:hypothetical protein
MTHPRKLIRHAVAAQLLNKTAAGDRIYKGRALPYRSVELPALAVYVPSETSVSNGTAPRELDRRPELVIEGAVRVSDPEGIEDAMDDLAEQVEAALHADETFGAKAADAELRNTELDIIADGDQITGVVRLTFEVKYYAYVFDPALPSDDFRTVGAEYNPDGAVHPADRANDTVTIPET